MKIKPQNRRKTVAINTVTRLANVFDRYPPTFNEKLASTLLHAYEFIIPKYDLSGDHVDKLLLNLGYYLHYFELNLPKSEQVYHSLLAKHGANSKVESEVVAHAYNQLGLVKLKQNEYKRAKHFFLKALIIYRREKGKFSEESLSIYESLSILLAQSGQYRRANIIASILIDHIDSDENIQTSSYASLLNTLGGIYREQENYKLATQHYRKSIELLTVQFGDKPHVDIALAKRELGHICDEMGDLMTAKELIAESIRLYQQLFPNGHPETAVAYMTLALLHLHNWNYDKAFKVNAQAIEMLTRLKLLMTFDTSTAYNIHAELCKSAEDFDQARDFYIRSLNIRRQLQGENSLDAALVEQNLAVLDMEMGNKDTAIIQLEHVLAVYQSHNAEDDIHCAFTKDNLASLYLENGMLSQALKHRKTSLKIIVKHKGIEHPDSILSINNMVLVYIAMKRYGISIRILNKLQTLLNKFDPELAAPHSSALHHTYARIFYDIKEWEDEKRHLDAAIFWAEKTWGRDHLFYANILFDIGLNCLNTSDIDAARSAFSDAYAIQVSKLPQEHPDVVSTKDQLDNLP